MSEKLKPCPFCGREAFLSDDDSVAFYVGCANGVCEVSPSLERASKAAAIAAWNRRADPLIEKAREALRAVLRWAESPSIPLGAAEQYESAIKAGHEALAALSPKDGSESLEVDDA